MTLVESAKFYSLIYRMDLGTIVEPLIDAYRHKFVLCVTSEPLLDSEYKITAISKEAPRPREARSMCKVEPIIPPDAILGLCERHDYDTDLGRLVEFTIPRNKAGTFKLAAPQAQKLAPKKSSVPLQHSQAEI